MENCLNVIFMLLHFHNIHDLYMVQGPSNLYGDFSFFFSIFNLYRLQRSLKKIFLFFISFMTLQKRNSGTFSLFFILDSFRIAFSRFLLIQIDDLGMSGGYS